MSNRISLILRAIVDGDTFKGSIYVLCRAIKEIRIPGQIHGTDGSSVLVMRKELINALYYATGPRKAIRNPYIAPIGLEVPVNINDLALNYALVLEDLDELPLETSLPVRVLHCSCLGFHFAFLSALKNLPGRTSASTKSLFNFFLTQFSPIASSLYLL